MCHGASQYSLSGDLVEHSKACSDTHYCADATGSAAVMNFMCETSPSQEEVVDLSTCADGADSDCSTYSWCGLASCNILSLSHSSSSSSLASWTLTSPRLAGWAQDVSDDDESEVIARLADEDWSVVEELVGPVKTLRTSALVTIIMPYQVKVTSRRGGRRGLCRTRLT